MASKVEDSEALLRRGFACEALVDGVLYKTVGVIHPDPCNQRRSGQAIDQQKEYISILSTEYETIAYEEGLGSTVPEHQRTRCLHDWDLLRALGHGDERRGAYLESLAVEVGIQRLRGRWQRDGCKEIDAKEAIIQRVISLGDQMSEDYTAIAIVRSYFSFLKTVWPLWFPDEDISRREVVRRSVVQADRSRKIASSEGCKLMLVLVGALHEPDVLRRLCDRRYTLRRLLYNLGPTPVNG